MSNNDDKFCQAIIVRNKKAFYDYKILEKFESGIILQGWEVKSIRSSKVQITNSYIHFKKREIWLFNCLISPLLSTCVNLNVDCTATKKLLLNRSEINKIMGKVQKKGITCIPLYMYWKGHRVKITIALAKGKKVHDKRQVQKDKDWLRTKDQLFKKLQH